MISPIYILVQLDMLKFRFPNHLGMYKCIHFQLFHLFYISN